MLLPCRGDMSCFTGWARALRGSERVVEQPGCAIGFAVGRCRRAKGTGEISSRPGPQNDLIILHLTATMHAVRTSGSSMVDDGWDAAFAGGGLAVGFRVSVELHPVPMEHGVPQARKSPFFCVPKLEVEGKVACREPRHARLSFGAEWEWGGQAGVHGMAW